MDVTERDRLALASPVRLREAGYSVSDDEADCRCPGPSWAARIAQRAAEARMAKAVRALGQLTRDDVAALLAALAGRTDG